MVLVMSAPKSPRPHKSAPSSVLKVLTQFVQQAPRKVPFSKLILQANARVPRLFVEGGGDYPLVGDRYIVGRSSKSCDIVVASPLVSQVHLSLSRDRRRGSRFVIRDEKSTNGLYRQNRRIQETPLYHNDIITLGPPELASVVRLRFSDPPPLFVRAGRYGIYGMVALVSLVTLWLGLEWNRFSVNPLPIAIQGPVVVFARDGQTPLVPPTNETHRELKQLTDFSANLPKAVIASEDSRYYWHLGVDPLGMLRAFIANLQGGEIREGASTITQQLARSLFREYVGKEDSLGRKLKEMVVALKLEASYSKDFLMLTYLNQVFLGRDHYGFEDASRFYFDKSAKDLTLSEAATLVGILPAPNRFNPVRDYQYAVEYRDRVLNRMGELGLVSQEEAQRARRSRIELSPKAREQLQSTKAPYFHEYVFLELDQLLGSDLAREGNFIVQTGLDLGMQAKAESNLLTAVNEQGAVQGFSQGAIATVDANTGEIRALVGGVAFQQSQYNRATQAVRQPGSTFKVFTYAAALIEGISPSTTYSCGDLNWSGQFFAGCNPSRNEDMYQALARSDNTVALRIAQEVGLPKVIKLARKMGVRSQLQSVPGLVLGQSEVTLLEMAGAYGVFANQGRFNRPHAIQRIIDRNDCTNFQQPKTCRVIYDFNQSSESNIPAIPAPVADTMTTLLQGVIQAGTGNSAFIGRGEAGKTGTTNNGVDLWFVGYVPSNKLVTGIWLGNDENRSTFGAGAEAARIWGRYMGDVLR